MNNSVVLDTGFLISLVDRNRPCHETAKEYYKYFLENEISMLLPTVVASEFALKQPITDLPLRNFRILPFNLNEATKSAMLNAFYYRKQDSVGQRDSVKDDFKIMAQADEQKAGFLITEDVSTLIHYHGRLSQDSKIGFRIIKLTDGFDVSFIRADGQCDLSFGGS